jgi:hypothetical protein
MLTRRLGGAGIARGGPARRPLMFAATVALLALLILPGSVLATIRITSTVLSGGGSSGTAITVAPGTTVTDVAYVNFDQHGAGGHVYYYWYSSLADCGNKANGNAAGDFPQLANEFGANPLHASNGVQFSTPGTYYWRAQFSWIRSVTDPSIDSTWSACDEIVTVEASPTINTTPSAGGPIGTVLNDSATLAGGNSPTGTITFRLYPPSSPSCDGGAVYTESVTVSGNGPYGTSPGFTTVVAGTYRWTAAYSGDSTNNPASSGCQEEQVVVTKAEPSIDTLLSVGNGPASKSLSVAPGTTVTDTATISNAYQPSGAVGFYIYAGNACQGESVYVEGAISGASASAQHVFNAAGTYSWRAYWGGDANNEPAWSACDEFVYVNQAVPSIRTVPSASQVEVGASITDTAYVTGGDQPTGSVAFYLYPPSDPTCQASPVFQQSVNLVNGVATTNPVQLTVEGTYHWSALYSGDSKNAAVAHICGEPVRVGSQPIPTPEPTPTPTPTPTPELTPTPTPTPEFTPAPSGSVEPTASPSGSTMPETTAGSSSGTSDGGVFPIILVVLALGAGGLLILSPLPRRIR